MADARLNDLTEATTPVSTDIVYVVRDPAGTPTDRKVKLSNLRTAIGAQPLDSDLTAIAALTTTSYGRAVLVLADAAALRTAAGLGTAAVVNTGTSGANVPTITQADARYEGIGTSVAIDTLVLNVKDHGAVGDGVADDRAAIQAVIDTVVAAGGGRVFFPAGTYKIMNSLTIATSGADVSGVHLIGVGIKSQILNGHATASAIVLTGAATPYYVRNCVFSDLWIKGNGGSGKGLTGDYAIENDYERLLITGCNGAMAFTNSWASCVRRCSLRSNSAGGNAALDLGSTVNGFTVLACWIQGNNGIGVNIHGVSNYGIGIVENEIEGNAGAAIVVASTTECRGLTIHGNYFELNGGANPQIQLTATGTIDGVSIRGNLIDGATVNTYPVRVLAGTNVEIDGNSFFRHATADAVSWTAGLSTEKIGPDIITTRTWTGGPAVWAANNLALIARINIPVKRAYRYGLFYVAAQSGNVQFAVLKLSGTDNETFTRRMSSGIIACPAVGRARVDLGSTVLEPGDYALALWADNTTFSTLHGGDLTNETIRNTGDYTNAAGIPAGPIAAFTTWATQQTITLGLETA